MTKIHICINMYSVSAVRIDPQHIRDWACAFHNSVSVSLSRGIASRNKPREAVRYEQRLKPAYKQRIHTTNHLPIVGFVKMKHVHTHVLAAEH
jgi:hypothetical protein